MKLYKISELERGGLVFGFKMRKILRLIHSGELKAINITPNGRRATYRVSDKDLKNFINSHGISS